MANLRTNNLSGEQGQNAYRGSVHFSGDGTALRAVESDSNLTFGTGDFTIEFWILRNNTEQAVYLDWRNAGGAQGHRVTLYSTSGGANLYFYSNGSNHITTTDPLNTNSWHHVALARGSSSSKLFVNGVQVGSTYSDSNDYVGPQDSGGIYIGRFAGGSYDTKGHISNLRIVKGTALYTSDFTPPQSELTVVDGTVLLCCQDSDDATKDAVGTTITTEGNLNNTDLTKLQPKIIPPYGVDAGNAFGGTIQQSTEGYMYFPTGRTEERGRGRAIWGGGQNPSNKVVMDFFQIQTGGITFDFGNLTDARNEVRACGSSTRGVWAGGRDPGLSNIIDFVEIPTTANAVDFGNLTVARAAVAAVSNLTRGCFMAGFAPSNTNHIDFITIATKGNATDFGDMLGTYQAQGRAMSPTRGLAAGNYGASNLIEFITIASTGNSTDFGDRTVAAYSASGTSDNTRGVFTGGDGPTTNVIDFVTMASAGNATDFGDLITANGSSHADTSDSIIGCIAGGQSNTNAIEKITIQSTGDAVDYGDLTSGRSQLGATSDSHGGL